MNPADLAVERFGHGYSCSQSVFSACAEPRGVDRDLALRIAAGLSGGIGRTAQTCGCVTGAVLALGLAQRSVRPEDNRQEKDKTCETAQKLMREFAARHGSILCRDLLGCDISTTEGRQKARESGLFQSKCPAFGRGAVELVEQTLAETA